MLPQRGDTKEACALIASKKLKSPADMQLDYQTQQVHIGSEGETYPTGELWEHAN
jgi:hypothetical protein